MPGPGIIDPGVSILIFPEISPSPKHPLQPAEHPQEQIGEQRGNDLPKGDRVRTQREDKSALDEELQKSRLHPG
jgi:hypothetical protein